MGVPSFYRWLVEKYPNIVSPAVEEEEGVGEHRPDGAAAEVRYDNLYLDMNGIIHPCFHPEDHTGCPPPATFDEVFRSMFEYIDRLIRIARPRRLLYLAVDGVAPRAKMNQQRARRLKSAKAAKEAEIEENLLRDRFRAQGKEVLPPDETPCEVSDPNIITPGTEFMERLSVALEYYVRARLNTHPRWKDIKVILSDANVPGEGEHKIMSFIRAQRCMEGYDPNTRHCLYGLDADLIMLALASHEVHFSILREDVMRQSKQPKVCVPVAEASSTAQELQKVKCRGWFPRITEAKPEGKLPKKPYEFLNIWVLREYLELEMTIPGCKHNIERLIDDFIFICFMTGNDFIPHIPSLEIHEYAVDLLIDVYKTTFNKMGGYIVDTDKIKDKYAACLKVSRLEKFFHELALHEEKIFLKRYELREKLLRKIQREAAEVEWNERNCDLVEESSSVDLMDKSFLKQASISTSNDVDENTLELRRSLKDNLRSKEDIFKSGSSKHDRIRLGLPGWKTRFFREKFGAETTNEVGRLQTEMAQKYLEGLCWVLRYYFSDVPSWSWYYPFYYAPFASDLKHLSKFKISFTMDKPLRPFDQLMAVLPPESSYALPKCYSKLMGCDESTIQMFYPSELEIDTHGKRFLWQGVAKLPFIDVKLLLSATKTVEKDLALHEMNRNTVCQEKIFLRNSNPLANNAAFTEVSECTAKKLPISTRYWKPGHLEISGWLSLDEDAAGGNLFRSPIIDLPDIACNQTISAVFFNPEAVKPISRLLDNAIVPEKNLSESDIRNRPMWHTYQGPRPPIVTSRPESMWKASSPAMQPREEVRNAGTGWMGRGRGSAAAAAAITETRPIGRSSYGRVGGNNAGAAEVLQRGGGSYGRGFEGGARAYSFRPGGAWAGGTSSAQQQQTAWRPVGAWARGGGRDGGGGGDRQHRAW